MSQRLVDLLKELATITSGYFSSKRTGTREPPHGQIENYNIAIPGLPSVQWMAVIHLNAGCLPLLTKKKKTTKKTNKKKTKKKQQMEKKKKKKSSNSDRMDL